MQTINLARIRHSAASDSRHQWIQNVATFRAVFHCGIRRLRRQTTRTSKDKQDAWPHLSIDHSNSLQLLS